MTQYTLDGVGILALLIQFVLPLVVALVTKWKTHPTAKAILLLFLTAVTQFLTLWYQDASNHVQFDGAFVLYNIVVGFVISVASYFGLWKSTSVRAKLQSVGSGPDSSKLAA